MRTRPIAAATATAAATAAECAAAPLDGDLYALPAMAAGVEQYPWSLTQLCELLED